MDHCIVPSTTDPETTYRVIRTPSGLVCSCLGSLYHHGICSHQRIAAEWFAGMAESSSLAIDAAQQARLLADRVQAVADKLQSEKLPPDIVKLCWDKLDDIDKILNSIHAQIGRNKISS